MIEEAKLTKIVGAGNVSYEQAVLEEYSKDMSFVNAVRPVCVVKPTNSKPPLIPVHRVGFSGCLNKIHL